MLATDLGLLGTVIIESSNLSRIWTVNTVYAPVPERHLGGIRLKLVDQKNFVSFCNQRDFEVLSGIAKPGELCRWTDRDYPEPGDHDWIGLCMDAIDLEDDLYERELALRAEYPGVPLPDASEIWRRVHPGVTRDAEDFWVLLRDVAPETGYGPDPRIENIYTRWSCVSRDWFDWRRA